MLATPQLETRMLSRCSLLSIIASVVILLAGPTAALGALIQPDTAVTSSEFNASYAGTNTINGSGLPAGFTVSDPHAAYTVGNHWTTASGTAPTDQFITWGFTTPQALGSIHIWNHQSSPGHASNPGYDVTLFDLTLLTAADATLLTLNNVALAPDTATGQTFSFGSTIPGISKVRFDIEAVQSSPNFTGLAEVAFSVTAIPEPSTYALMLGGLGLIVFVTRRRNKLYGGGAVSQ